jgi:hypothetical protein
VKSPKLYLRDSGLLHALLGLGSSDALRAHPKVGASWEGWVIEQLVGTLGMIGEAPNAFFWRTHAGAEVDLLLELRGRLVPIERVPRVERGLVECMKDLELARGFVVHGGDATFRLRDGVWALSVAILGKPRELVGMLAAE